MGRRSINTTKSGKYMNPTDQARKEARKKELKKNKRQRQMVRAAVLKMKDPAQILEELEKIDEMEYNVLQPSPLNEKVLKEKRKKLKETLDRVLKMYDKDEPEKWAELKRQEGDYERRRQALAAYYESVRHAQAVQVDDIPLPTLQVPDNLMYGNMPSQIPLPIELTPNMPMPPPKPMGILKKDPMFMSALDLQPALEPPGVPPGPPPSLDDMSDDENETKRTRTLRFSDEPENDQGIKNYEQMDVDKRLPGPSSVMVETVKPTSLQQRMLALSGQNIDEFMKEMEEVQKRREIDKANDLTSRLSALERRKGDSKADDEDPSDKMAMYPPGTSGLDGSHIPPPLMTNMNRPPPLRPPGPPPPGVRMPPPMQNRPAAPPGPPPGPPPRMIRLPPGPPPGLPPRALPRPISHNLPPHPMSLLSNALPVFSAAPQLINRKDSHGATIMAKPQIRNLSADVTRFVPSALRVKRDEKKVQKPGIRAPTYDVRKPTEMAQKTVAPTKDDAYMQFMQEMQGLL